MLIRIWASTFCRQKITEAFLMVETGRAVAFVMDDILLASLAANSKILANTRSAKKRCR
jgi:ABC-type amino acid transport substrate-binding protein